MRLIYTDEQTDIIAMLAALFSDRCPPELVRELSEPESDGFPAELWQSLTETGIFGLAVGTDHGGAEAGLYELGLVFGEAGKVLCPTVVYNTLQFGVALERLGSAEQAGRYLPRLVAGELKATAQLSNPSDASRTRPALVAEPVRGGWLVSGKVKFVGNAALAEVILLTARAEAFPNPTQTIGLLVEPGEGVEISPLRSFAGDKLSTVTLDGCFVADSNVLRGANDGGLAAEDLTSAANAIVALQCMEMVGGATAILDRTVEYIREREQFGRSIASFQAAQHHVANMRISLEGARLTASQAIWWIGRGEPATRAVAIAKMKCSECYKQITLTAHQLHGGIGYVRETGLHMWSERAKVAEVQYGSADVAAGWLEAKLGLAD